MSTGSHIEPSKAEMSIGSRIESSILWSHRPHLAHLANQIYMVHHTYHDTEYPEPL